MYIKPAEPQDIPALNQLINSAYRGESSRRGWTTEADLLDGIRTDENALGTLLVSPGAVLLTGRQEDDEIIGCVYLQPEGKAMYLGMLTVSPSLQAKGIGTALLYAAETLTRERGCQHIRMTVISLRHELIAWYEKHGYRATGETKPFPTDPAFGIPKQPLSFVVLEKNIACR